LPREKASGLEAFSMLATLMEAESFALFLCLLASTEHPARMVASVHPGKGISRLQAGEAWRNVPGGEACAAERFPMHQQQAAERPPRTMHPVVTARQKGDPRKC